MTDKGLDNNTVKEIKVVDIAEWTDEQCTEYNKAPIVSAEGIRDLARAIVNLITNSHKLEQELNTFKAVLGSGQAIGYTIKCPHCGVEYNIRFEELNYGNPITCMDCGKEYLQNENIQGITLREGNKGEQ